MHYVNEAISINADAEREVSMYFNDKNLLLCGLDHGFSTMKGTHAIFNNGVEQLGGEATLSNNTLVYNGKNYKVGEGRLPMMKTKTEDESYFLLTLAGVAKELDVYQKQRADVILAVGLPFSRFGQEKQEFRDYLFRKVQGRFAFGIVVKITGFASKMCWYFHSAMLRLRTGCGCMVRRA